MNTEENLQELIAAAEAARGNAYAPYSKFRVGAAVRTASGKIFTGANVENALYGLSMCAERSAVFSAVGAGDSSIEAVAIVTENGAPPCGPCRQVLAEFGSDDLLVLRSDTSGATQQHPLGELLPESFSASYLLPG